MNFTEIVNDVADRLNQTSAAALTRIGTRVNQRYKIVTSAVGIIVGRRTTVQAAMSLGVDELTFTGIEKIIRVTQPSISARPLKELSYEEMVELPLALTNPTCYAIARMNARSVVILTNCTPQAAVTLYAEGLETKATLSGTDEPSFAESFHDILVEGVLVDEYRKTEKTDLLKISAALYGDRLKDLQLFIAKSSMQSVFQGKTRGNGCFPNDGVSGSGGSGSPIDGAQSYTQTGLITFDRNPLVPFAVTPGSDTVTNLSADLLDGLDSTDFLPQGVVAPSDGGVAGQVLTTGSTAVSGTNEALRRSTFSFFDTKLDDGDNAVITIDVKQTSHTSILKKTGLHVKAFTQPDDGGECSAILAVQTGGGNGISVYRRPDLRPSSLTDYSLTDPGGYALEAGTTAAWYASGAFAMAANSGCFVATILNSTGPNASGKGIAVNPQNLVFDTRPAYAVCSPQVNGVDLNYQWRVDCNGATTVKETTAPATPAANTAVVYAVDNGGGLTQYVAKLPSGSVHVLATDGFPSTYSEGSWTPVLGGSTSETGQSYSVQVGRYIKIGKQVHVQGRIVTTAKGTIVGSIVIKGLPFTTENVTNAYSAMTIGRFVGLATAMTTLTAYAAENSAFAVLAGCTAAALTTSPLLTADINNAVELVFQMTYRTA